MNDEKNKRRKEKVLLLPDQELGFAHHYVAPNRRFLEVQAAIFVYVPQYVG